MTQKHCLSFDIEEHFQVAAFASPLRRRHWDHFESRVENNTLLILDLLSTRNVRATFFVLGWVAERHPNLVRKLASAGHEIASHGHEHELITAQTPKSFREDVRKAKRVLEDITGQSVLGYRAPSFTITTQTQWALPILVEEGYLYDSSVFPVVHDLYGMPGATPWLHELVTPSGNLYELPPSTVGMGGFRIPAAGGGYFRLFPYKLMRVLLKRIEAGGHPLVMYFHPWEFDPYQPQMNGSWFSRFRHYNNLTKTQARLAQLLEDFSFEPFRDVISPVRGAGKEQGAADLSAGVSRYRRTNLRF